MTDTTAPTPPTDDEIVNDRAAKIEASIRGQLRDREIARRTQAQVEASLKASGIDLDASNLEEMARQRLLELEAQDQQVAADLRAHALYAEKYGRDFGALPLAE